MRDKMSDVVTGRISWFNSEKRFGFIKLDDGQGDAFLRYPTLKAGGFYFLPRGTTVRVSVSPDERGAPIVTQILHVDVTTANEGEPPALPRKARKGDTKAAVEGPE